MADKYYDWPVGYDVRGALSDVWGLEEHKLGDTTFTHFADGTARKNRMQGNDFVTSLMYTHGVTCFTCHDAHGTEYPPSLTEALRATSAWIVTDLARPTGRARRRSRSIHTTSPAAPAVSARRAICRRSRKRSAT